MSPQRKRGQFFFERRFLFSKDYWISFQKDFRIFLWFSIGSGSGFSSDFGHLDSLTQEYGTVFLRTLGLWFFHSDFGLRTLVFSGSSDFGFSFGFLDVGFSFGL